MTIFNMNVLGEWKNDKNVSSCKEVLYRGNIHQERWTYDLFSILGLLLTLLVLLYLCVCLWVAEKRIIHLMHPMSNLMYCCNTYQATRPSNDSWSLLVNLGLVIGGSTCSNSAPAKDKFRIETWLHHPKTWSVLTRCLSASLCQILNTKMMFILLSESLVVTHVHLE